MSSLACHSTNYTQVRFPTTDSTSVTGLGHVKMLGLVLPHRHPWRLFQKIIFIKRGACDIAVLGSISVLVLCLFVHFFLSIMNKFVVKAGFRTVI